MQYNFDRYIDRENTNCVKWDYNKEFFGREDVLPMRVADMDFESPPEVKETISRYAEHGVYGYFRRSQGYYRSIVDWLQKRHRWQVDRDWIVSTPGVVTALNIAIITYTSPGDKVLIQTPVYPPFYNIVRNNKRQLITNSLSEENGRYTMDFEDLETKLKDDVKMMILCNPHNPIGRVWTREELEKLCALCHEYGVLLVSDEIHSDIVYDDHQHIPIASLCADMLEYSITCIAPSKTFNVAGLEESATIIPNDELRGQFKLTMEKVGIGGGNIFGVAALEAAYTYGKQWLEELLIYLQGNLNYLDEQLKTSSSGVKFYMPDGTYLVWLDFRSTGLLGDELFRFIVDEAKLGLNDGRSFGGEGNGFMRMNIACPRSILEEGVDRLLRVL